MRSPANHFFGISSLRTDRRRKEGGLELDQIQSRAPPPPSAIPPSPSLNGQTNSRLRSFPRNGTQEWNGMPDGDGQAALSSSVSAGSTFTLSRIGISVLPFICHFNSLLQRSAKRRGCLLSYSQAEPGRESTEPSPRLLVEPCTS